MLKIRDSISLALSFNGKEFPLESSSFQSLTIHSSVRVLLPTFEITLMDNGGYFTNTVPIEDGVQMEVQIGNDGGATPKTLTFRVFRWKSGTNGGVETYRIVGYFDSAVYMFQAATEGINGTSSDALKKIAAKCGLTYKGDPTNDTQIWLPGNQRYGVFAQQIARRGYLNDQSFMKLAVTMMGQMRYRNMSLVDTNSQVKNFTHTDDESAADGFYKVIDQHHVTNSGFQNSNGGYSHQVVSQAIHKETSVTKKLSLKRLTENLMLNEDVKGDIDRSRVDIAPIDCGNVHDKYEAGLYQNMRSSMLYSFGNDVMVQDQCAVDLLEMVNYNSFKASNAGIERNETFTSAYIVTGKVIHLDVGNYYEVYNLSTTGLNKEVVEDGSI